MRLLPRLVAASAGCIVTIGVALAVGLDPASAAAPTAPSVDPDALDTTPMLGGGVEGFVESSASGQHWLVRDFAQIGDRLFVAGAFTSTTELPYDGAPSHPQAFLAAFDVDTNAVISSWQPQLDDVAWALEVVDGNLVVGGEFDTVNGVPREGLVAIDPVTGATVSGFQAEIANDGSSYEASVRDLLVVGDDLYVVGDFNRLVDPGGRHGRYRTARVDAATGAVDQGWIPLVTGGSVFDVEHDADLGRLVLAGLFTAVAAQPDTAGAAILSEADASVLPGFPMSYNGPFFKTFGATIEQGTYWIAGEQHYTQLRDRDDWSFVGCVTGGFRGLVPEVCRATSWHGGSGQGGDYQVAVTLAPDVVALGCHCRGVYWNSISENDDDLGNLGGVRLYHADGWEWDWQPDLQYWNEGPYSLFADSNGCVYVGGDYTGTVDGFGRFCPTDPPEPVDTDGDGVTDAAERVDGLPVDTDGDGIDDELDLDSDGDAVPDVVEAGLPDLDTDFLATVDDRNTVTEPPDTDGDGIPDLRDLESANPANDGTAFDVAATAAAALDTSGDGRVDGDDAVGGTDADSNGVDDAVEAALAAPRSIDAGMVLADPEGDAATTAWELPVRLSAPTSAVVTVDWQLLPVDANDGVAEPGVDLVDSSGTITFDPGVTETTVTIEVIGDTLVEPPLWGGEWGLVQLSAPSDNAEIGPGVFWGLGLVIIFDDDV